MFINRRTRMIFGSIILALLVGAGLWHWDYATPAAHLLASLPRYPNSRSTHQSDPGAMHMVPVTPSVRTATAEWIIPASVARTKAWYRSHMDRLGYSTALPFLNTTPMGSQGGLSFIDPTRPDTTVQISFVPLASNKTLVYTYVAALAVLKRPAGERLASSVNRVVITPYPQGLQQPALPAITVTNPQLLRQWIQLFNQHLRVAPSPGAQTCAQDPKWFTVELDQPHGPATHLTINPACGLIYDRGYPTLVDPDGSFIQSIRAQAHHGMR